MERLKAQEIQKQMRELCNWKLRTLLGFDYVDQITNQILSIENEEDVRNYIRVSGSEHSSQSDFLFSSITLLIRTTSIIHNYPNKSTGSLENYFL
jgi:hypothetical protein